MIDLESLSKVSYAIALERFKKKQMENPACSENTLKHCATEVVEAVSALNNWISYGAENGDKCHLTRKEKRVYARLKQDFADELADIVLCVLTVAGGENIDLEAAVFRCLRKNKKRAEGGEK